MPLRECWAVSLTRTRIRECNALEADDDAEHAQEDEREEAVPEHGRGPVRVDPALAHEVQQTVDGPRADERDAVDVRELWLTGLGSRSKYELRDRVLTWARH